MIWTVNKDQNNGSGIAVVFSLASAKWPRSLEAVRYHWPTWTYFPMVNCLNLENVMLSSAAPWLGALRRKILVIPMPEVFRVREVKFFIADSLLRNNYLFVWKVTSQLNGVFYWWLVINHSQYLIHRGVSAQCMELWTVWCSWSGSRSTPLLSWQ